MIHVCRLDIGSRHVFDSANGINDVGSLSAAIEHQFNIARVKQVLIISGGEVLNDNEQKLYRLSAGREESPIYLIDKDIVESEHPPSLEMPLDTLTQDLKQDIEAAINMRPSYQTLQVRSQLAARVYELSKNLHNICQSFYDDQYWQYQGFLALIANLDEFVSSFRKRQNMINEQFDKYLNNKTYFKHLMTDIDKYIEVLGKIRLLPQIIEQFQSDSNSTSTNQKTGNIFGSLSCQSISGIQQSLQLNELKLKQNLNCANTNVDLTLLEWIKSVDPQNKMNAVIDDTKEMLKNFDSNFKWKDLRNNISLLISQFDNNQQMKEIEGLTKRLQDLNSFLDKSKTFLAGQCDITESFAANKERAASLNDESILNDLCKGHRCQLELFKSNHSNMIEITKKISKAKLELIRVIHSRLNWVMRIQNQMAEHDFQLDIYFKQLQRIDVRLKLMEQLKRSPFIYIFSMKETIRRQSFSRIYKTFAKSICDLISRVYKNEMQKRELFDSKIAPLSKHFILSIMFRSLNDKVEPFLNDTALKFDAKLPQLNESDVAQIEADLRSQINELKLNNSYSFSFASSSSGSSGSLSSSTAHQSEPSSPSYSNSESSAETLEKKPKLSTIANVNNNDIFWNELSLFDSNKHDPELSQLTSLLDFINSKEIKQPSTSMNEAPAACNQNEIKRMFELKINDIKAKLSETKELLRAYQNELKFNIDNILNKHIESEKLTQQRNEKHQQIEQNKSKFYAQFIEFIQSSEKNSNEQVFIDKLSNDSDREFSVQLLAYLKKCEHENQKQIEELKATIKTVKVNTNADKQILFNEAIKRVTQDKDKIIETLKQKEKDYEALKRVTLDQDKTIEEYKLKEKEYLNQISSLQVNIDEMANNLKDVSNDTVLISNEKSKPLEVQSTEGLPISVGQENLSTEDINQTKMKLKELMLLEKITQLEKQLSLFTTLPVTNDYETIQLHSCNIDDLVIAVYSESYGSYKIIHKSSNYLHFVHSAIFKSHEQRLSFKNPNSINIRASHLATSPSSSPLNEVSQMELQFVTTNPSDIDSSIASSSNHQKMYSNQQSDIVGSDDTANSSTPNPLVKNSPSDNIHNIFMSEKQPQWFVGRVLVKEFCIARKENNRFRVPSGTRFYRVKLKPYNL